MLKTKLLIHIDKPVSGIPNPVSFDFLTNKNDLGDEGTIIGIIEQIAPVYSKIVELIGVNGTALIEIPTEHWFGQWRVAILSVSIQNSTLTLAITNTAPDQKSVMPPRSGYYDPNEAGSESCRDKQIDETSKV